MAEVGLGRAGIVLGLEVSRLARNSTDWHRLLEICALTDTLILDEDGVYDPAHFNDRLLLGLKGTMSEAELHVLRARLRGGILNKARRGELQMCHCRSASFTTLTGRARAGPRSAGASKAFDSSFETFRRTAFGLRGGQGLPPEGTLFPRRLQEGPNKGDLVWSRTRPHSRALTILHNPRYAGAFVFGRTRTRKNDRGRQHHTYVCRASNGTPALGAHPGYISWEQYEENQRRLRENAQAPWRRSPQESAARRSGTVARPGGLRRLRRAG